MGRRDRPDPDGRAFRRSGRRPRLARKLVASGARDPHVRVLAVGGRDLREAGAEIVQDIGRARRDGIRRDPAPDSAICKRSRAGRLHADHRRRASRRRRADRLPRLQPADCSHRHAIGSIAGSRRLLHRAAGVGLGRRSRSARSGEAVDRMVVVFPFEEEIYRQAPGSAWTSWGIPLLDSLPDAPSKSRGAATSWVSGPGTELVSSGFCPAAGYRKCAGSSP